MYTGFFSCHLSPFVRPRSRVISYCPRHPLGSKLDVLLSTLRKPIYLAIRSKVHAMTAGKRKHSRASILTRVDATHSWSARRDAKFLDAATADVVLEGLFGELLSDRDGTLRHARLSIRAVWLAQTCSMHHWRILSSGSVSN